MSVGISSRIKSVIVAPPDFVLSWLSGFIKFYPWYLRVGLVLQRMVQ